MNIVNVFFFFFFFFFLNSVLRPFQDFFSSYETGQSVGGRKQNQEKTTRHTRKENLACLSQVASAGVR